jgi:hypothetical protein
MRNSLEIDQIAQNSSEIFAQSAENGEAAAKDRILSKKRRNFCQGGKGL